MSKVCTHQVFRLVSHWTCEGCRQQVQLIADFNVDKEGRPGTQSREDFVREHGEQMTSVVEDHLKECAGECSVAGRTVN